MYVSADWSGRPALEAGQVHLFLACLVGVTERETLTEQFTALRQRIKAQYPQKTVEELHGHQMQPKFIAAALQIGIELQMRVGIVMLDKSAAAQQGTLPAADELHALTALRIWPEFLAFGPVTRFDYDTDIGGKERQKRFETSLKRINASIHPTQKLKTKSFHSTKSDVIQLADVVAYAFARQEKGQKVEPEIVRCLREIRRAPNSIIYDVEAWGK